MSDTAAKKVIRLPVERLDRSRPFGEVFGDHIHKIAYTQRALGLECWPYNARGELIEAALTKEQREKLDDRRKKAAAEPERPAPKPTDEVNDDGLGEEERAEPREDETEGVNLVSWLKGEVRYRPNEIQDVIKRRYHANKPKMADAALYLVEEKKLLPRAQVHPSILPRQD